MHGVVLRFAEVPAEEPVAAEVEEPAVQEEAAHAETEVAEVAEVVMPEEVHADQL